MTLGQRVKGGGAVAHEDRRWRAAVGPAWVEVDLDAVAANVRWIRRLVGPGCRVMAVVKANAYGHGALPVATAALGAGADALGVSTVAEGLALREAGVVAPLLVFTPARPADLAPAVEAGLTLAVVSADGAEMLAEAAAAAAVRASAHVKYDTGMGRYGFARGELDAALPRLRAAGDAVRWEGVFTHFARGAHVGATAQQLARFLEMVRAAEAAGLRFEVRHAAASAAAIRLPAARLDMVRVGTLMYGDVPAGVGPIPELRRVFAFRAEATQLRVVPRGAAVGYGSQWRAPRPTRVAVIPVGYADGFDVTPAGPYRRPATLLRALARAVLERMGWGRRLGAGLAQVTWAGVTVPVLGRVGMQQLCVDCGAIPDAALESPAELHVRATAVSAHVSRVYLRDGTVQYAATPLGRIDVHVGARPT